MTLLVALAGPSRSGKGTCARVFAQRCAEEGLTSFERQLSDNGKWHAARSFRPDISRVEAVALFDHLKTLPHPSVDVRYSTSEMMGKPAYVTVPLQCYLQNFLQSERDVWGDDYWIDRILPLHDQPRWPGPFWLDGFFDEEAGVEPTDLALVSDLRQPNEAQRVRDLGGVVIECRRPTVADPYRTGADHVTEQRLPPELVDYVIANTEDEEALKHAARIAFDAVVAPLARSRA